MEERLYWEHEIHRSARGLCSSCQKILWMDCKKRYRIVNKCDGEGYKPVSECSGFEPIETVEQKV